MEDIDLRLVDRATNRARHYHIAAGRLLFDEPALVITWGRIGVPPRIRVETFADEAAMLARRRALVDRRSAHGYQRCNVETSSAEN